MAELLHVAIELPSCLRRDGLQNCSLILALTQQDFGQDISLLLSPVLTFALTVLRNHILDRLIAGKMLTDRGCNWLRAKVMGALLVERNVLLEIWGFIFCVWGPFQLQKVHIYQLAPTS